MSTPPTPDETSPAPRPSRFARLQKATDRVPTKWFAAIGTGIFLAATAAFGGLAPVAVADKTLPDLTAGEPHTSAQLEVTVERAVLIDSLSGSGVTPDPDKGERLLVLLVRVENLWDRPLSSSSPESFERAVMLAGGARTAGAVVREDDQTSPLWLQPDVPALLAYTWAVGPDDHAGGEDLTVVLQDAELIVGQLLYTGEDWGDYAPAATVTVELEDAGSETDG